MDIDSLKTKIKDKLAGAGSLNAQVAFDFGDDGVFYVDAMQSPAVLIDAMDDPDLTITTSLDTFSAILEGRQDPNIAFMMGKLKVKGPMGLAMKLNGMLED